MNTNLWSRQVQKVTVGGKWNINSSLLKKANLKGNNLSTNSTNGGAKSSSLSPAATSSTSTSLAQHVGAAEPSSMKQAKLKRSKWPKRVLYGSVLTFLGASGATYYSLSFETNDKKGKRKIVTFGDKLSADYNKIVIEYAPTVYTALGPESVVASIVNGAKKVVNYFKVDDNNVTKVDASSNLQSKTPIIGKSMKQDILEVKPSASGFRESEKIGTNVVEVQKVPLDVLEKGMTKERWMKIKYDLVLLENRLEGELRKEADYARMKSRLALEKKQQENIIEKEEEQKKDIAKSEPIEVAKEATGRAGIISGLKSKLSQIFTSDLNNSYDSYSSTDNYDETKISEVEKNLSKDLETVLVTDLNIRSVDELKRRVVQLVLELKDRTRWEAIRLLKVLEIESAKMKVKATELLQKQEAIYEQLLKQEKEEVEEKTRNEVKQIERLQYEEMLESQRNEWKNNYDQIIQQTKDQINGQYKEKVKEVYLKYKNETKKVQEDYNIKTEEMEQKVRQVQSEHENLELALSFSAMIHRLSLNLMQLNHRIISHQPFKRELDEIKLNAAAAKDEMLVNMLDSIPDKLAETGMLSPTETKAQFIQIYSNLSKVVLIPEEEKSNPTMFNHFLASVVAKLSFSDAKAQDLSPATIELQERILHEANDLVLKKGDFIAAASKLNELNENTKNYPGTKAFIELVNNQNNVQQVLRFTELHITKLAKQIVDANLSQK